MLVLTRKTSQKLQIGDNVTVEILEVRGGAVRLGIVAPPSVPVLRHELAERIAAGQTDALVRGAPANVTESRRNSGELASPRAPRNAESRARWGWFQESVEPQEGAELAPAVSSANRPSRFIASSALASLVAARRR